MPTNSVDRQNQTHARRPVVPLSLRLKRESELQAFSCVLTMPTHARNGLSGGVARRYKAVAKTCINASRDALV